MLRIKLDLTHPLDTKWQITSNVLCWVSNRIFWGAPSGSRGRSIAPLPRRRAFATARRIEMAHSGSGVILGRIVPCRANRKSRGVKCDCLAGLVDCSSIRSQVSQTISGLLRADGYDHDTVELDEERHCRSVGCRSPSDRVLERSGFLVGR